MGNKSSNKIPDKGFKVLSVKSQSPLQGSLNVLTDYLISINDKKLSGDIKEIPALLNKINESPKTNFAKIGIWNNLHQHFRIEAQNVKEQGTRLNVDVDYTTTAINPLRITSIMLNSPASRCGLEVVKDQIVGQSDVVTANFLSLEDFGDQILKCQGRKKLMQIFVQNAESNNFRQVQMLPEKSVDYDGFLGCEVAEGLLNRPKPTLAKGQQEIECYSKSGEIEKFVTQDWHVQFACIQQIWRENMKHETESNIVNDEINKLDNESKNESKNAITNNNMNENGLQKIKEEDEDDNIETNKINENNADNQDQNKIDEQYLTQFSKHSEEDNNLIQEKEYEEVKAKDNIDNQSILVKLFKLSNSAVFIRVAKQLYFSEIYKISLSDLNLYYRWNPEFSHIILSQIQKFNHQINYKLKDEIMEETIILVNTFNVLKNYFKVAKKQKDLDKDLIQNFFRNKDQLDLLIKSINTQTIFQSIQIYLLNSNANVIQIQDKENFILILINLQSLLSNSSDIGYALINKIKVSIVWNCISNQFLLSKDTKTVNIDFVKMFSDRQYLKSQTDLFKIIE